MVRTVGPFAETQHDMSLEPRRGVAARYLFAGSLVAVMAVCVVLWASLHVDDGLFVDSKAFYCAGQAIDTGHDPYLNASLMACENHLRTLQLHHWPGSQNIVVPVPLPPVAMLPFALLALLPFGAAIVLWTTLNIACAAWAAELLRRSFPSLSAPFIGTVVVLAVLPAGIRLGQPSGLILLAVVAAGLALRSRSRAGSIGWPALLALQPHIAVPLFASLLWAPFRAARWAAVATGAALLVLSAAVVGRLSFEYVTRVLPAHAGANLDDASQLAFPSALAAAGVPAHLAMVLGDATYAAAIVGGIAIAVRVARSSRRPEALVWLTTMIGTIAAPHLHTQQLVCALPGALLLCTLGTAPALARAAVYGMAIPWVSLLSLKWGPGFAIAAAAGEWRRPSPRRLLAGAALAASFAAVLIGLALLLAHLAQPLHVVRVLQPPAAALAEQTWAIGIAVDAAAFRTATLPARTVTWIAELVLLGLAVSAARFLPQHSKDVVRLNGTSVPIG
jgi:hypothetical protein